MSDDILQFGSLNDYRCLVPQLRVAITFYARQIDDGFQKTMVIWIALFNVWNNQGNHAIFERWFSGVTVDIRARMRISNPCNLYDAIIAPFS